MRRLALAVGVVLAATVGLQPTVSSAAGPALPTVASTTTLGVMTQHPAVRGRDNVRSAVFNGKSVWVFGDTMLGQQSAEGDNWADNSVAWTGDFDASNGVAGWSDYVDANGVPAEFLPLTEQERTYNRNHAGDDCAVEPCNAEVALWPGEIVADPARNRLLVFYGVIHRIIGQPEFHGVGTGIATWSPGGKVVRPILTPGATAPTLMFGPKSFGLGNGSIVVGTTLYNYGCQPEWIVTKCSVARVPLAQVLDKSAWRFFAGNGVWSTKPADALPVLDGGAAGTSVAWNPYLNAYLAIYSLNFTNDVMYRVAAKPEGPWSDAAKLFTGVAGYDGSANYAAAAHPEHATDNGRTQYVTYVRNSAFLAQEVHQMRVTFNAPAG